jgi:molybdopterin converting factor small subunit
MGEVSVLLFGPLAEAFGISESTQKIESSSTPETILLQMGLSEWKNKGLRCAINQKIGDFDIVLKDGDELVFLTPVSGG